MRGALAVALLALLAAAGGTAAQEEAHRFEIRQAGDSTIVFSTVGAPWVHAGMRGIAVDPAARDAMVARFRIVTVSNGAATALITGQTTHVTTDDVVLLEHPRTPWYRTATFWLGAAVGAVVGVIAR